MAVGKVITKSDIDNDASNVAIEVDNALRRASNFNDWLATQTESDLVAYGYTSQEVAILKSAYTNLDTLNSIYQGTANLPVSQDFRIFLRQLWGIPL